MESLAGFYKVIAFLLKYCYFVKTIAIRLKING